MNRTLLFTSTAAALCVMPSMVQAQPQTQETSQKAAAKVLIGGSGPPQHYQAVVDDLSDFLTSQGVASKQLDPGKSRDSYIEQLSALGAESLLFVVVDGVPNSVES